MAATASESQSDLNLTPSWTRSSFSKPFKRSGKKKGSDAGSIASSSGGNGNGGDAGGGSPYLRRNSTDSGRRLSLRLGGGRKRSKTPLMGRTDSESGSDVVSRTETGNEGLQVGGGEEDRDEYYTEEEEDT